MTGANPGLGHVYCFFFPLMVSRTYSECHITVILLSCLPGSILSAYLFLFTVSLGEAQRDSRDRCADGTLSGKQPLVLSPIRLSPSKPLEPAYPHPVHLPSWSCSHVHVTSFLAPQQLCLLVMTLLVPCGWCHRPVCQMTESPTEAPPTHQTQEPDLCWRNACQTLAGYTAVQ